MLATLISPPLCVKRSCCCVSLLISILLSGPVQADNHGAVASVVAENLLRNMIQGVEDKEIIVSRVSFPPRTQLPWHSHPGEEVFYVIEGSVILKRRDQPDVLSQAGDAQTIAPEVIHTGQTGESGAELVIFRVHTVGEPERTVVD